MPQPTSVTATAHRTVFTSANKGCRLSMAAAPHRGPHGRPVCSSGDYSAFMPAPLPPPLVWDEEAPVRVK